MSALASASGRAVAPARPAGLRACGASAPSWTPLRRCAVLRQPRPEAPCAIVAGALRARARACRRPAPACARAALAALTAPLTAAAPAMRQRDPPPETGAPLRLRRRQTRPPTGADAAPPAPLHTSPPFLHSPSSAGAAPAPCAARRGPARCAALPPAAVAAAADAAAGAQPLYALSEGLETPIQLIYLLSLLGFLAGGAYLVVRQVLVRRELDEAAKALGERVRTDEANCEDYFELGVILTRKQLFTPTPPNARQTRAGCLPDAAAGPHAAVSHAARPLLSLRRPAGHQEP